MGASESKLSVASTPKVDPSQRPKAARVASLADPRSPSCAIDRTPIQVGVAYSPLPVVESVGPGFVDPRSPTPGVTRTPIKVSVTSLARRLSTFFLNDVKSGGDSVSSLPPVSFTKHPSLPSVARQNDAGPREPLLPVVKAQNLASVREHTDAMFTPASSSPSEGYGSICSSPFVLVGETQMEVEVDTEASLEEGEEALLLGASTLRKELSLSLLACREGVYSSSLEERPLTPLPPAERQANEDHAYALFSAAQPSTESETSTLVAEAVVTLEEAEVPSQTSEEQVTAALPESSHEQPEVSKPLTPQPAVASSVSSTQVETVQSGIRCLKFDTRSPSQAIFKPQWLGVGFGTAGVRARGVQGRGKTSVSSPLSTKNTATNENNNMVVRAKQRQREKVLIGEGRSPLQILREANSPRDRNPQMKLKVSTPEKQRFSQMDRRALILSLNKENE
ncbi:Cell division cycle-associated protein 3 [Anabarilius grahami]|uniref:Cell division cycle-associated protein 3 n=1 Tax=Anabarilius grahami TaxID=495550 RepID=A0A3N0XIH4_ANAGA|nr:Cell division cycle-associated protein 3 [Anabarilius grahami]